MGNKYVPDRGLTVAEACRLIKVAPPTLVKWIQQGRIEADRPSTRSRRRWLVSRNSLAKFASEHGMTIHEEPENAANVIQQDDGTNQEPK